MVKKRQRKRVSAKKMAQAHSTSGSDYSVLAVPDGVEMFRPQQEGAYKIDILPYITKTNPMTPEPSGYEHYERTFWIHRQIGADQRTYVCPAKTVGQKCPICEEVRRQYREPNPDKDMLRSINAKQRQLFALINLDEKEKGIQIWDVSYHLFGSLLDDLIRADDENDYEFFYGLEDGKSLRVLLKPKQIGNGPPFLETVSIQFKDRRPYPEEVLDKVPCLDDLLIIKSYDELSAIFYQEAADGPAEISGEESVEVDDRAPWDNDGDDRVPAGKLKEEKEFDDEEWD